MEHLNTKGLRKFNKKMKKSQFIVENQTGIKCNMIPTKNLAICNAGLVNGLSQETVCENFVKYGPLDKIVMLEGKSCAFVAFKSQADAEKAFDNINGQLNIAQDNKPLRLLFSPLLPESSHLSNQIKPPGCYVLDDFITEEEERRLLSLIDFDETSSLKYRQVKHYGFEFRYDINNVDKDSPLNEQIPIQCNFLWPRLKGCISQLTFVEPDQLTVNCYKPGQGIPSHIDTHSAFEGALFSLSLGSSIVMDFRHDDRRHHSVFLPRRSLTVMSDECRYSWTHGITPRKMDIVATEDGLQVFHRQTRVSFTFRKVLKGECSCKFTNKCDSFLAKQAEKSEMADDVAAKLEQVHVQKVYDNIATHFSDTRHKPWPNVLEFIESFDLGSVLVDVGCGNGKYLGQNSRMFDVGCDASGSLAEVCKRRGHEIFTCNCLNIPLRSGIADGVISIAVIHHMATKERRLQAVREIFRLLKVNGRALIYVWAKDQAKDKEKSSYLKQNRRNRKGDLPEAEAATEVSVTREISLPVHTNRTQFQHADLLVPWKLKGEGDEKETFLRFYHVFEEGELESLCRDSELSQIEVVKSYYDQGNWCVLFKKIKEILT